MKTGGLTTFWEGRALISFTLMYIQMGGVGKVHHFHYQIFP